MKSALSILVFLLFLAAAIPSLGEGITVSGGAVELLGYQSPGYSYQVITPGGAVPAGWEQERFNDADWKVGTAAFGSEQGCPLSSTIHTRWEEKQDLLVRKTVFVPAGATNLKIMLALEGEAAPVFFNGVRISDARSKGCAGPDNVHIPVPQSLVRVGANLAAYHLHQDGVQSFFDTRVFAQSAAPAIAANPAELLPYQAPGYHYLQIAHGGPAPEGFEKVGFNDSGWKTGRAAFGNGGSCPLSPTVHTPWHDTTDLLVRRFITLPPGVSGVTILAAIDNSIVAIFFNGARISGAIAGDGCARADLVQVHVPPSLLKPGENLVVFHVRDDGLESFFDTRIMAVKDEEPATIVGWERLPTQVCEDEGPGTTCSLNGIFVFQNTGTGAYGASIVQLVLSNDSTPRQSDVFLKEVNAPEIDPGQRYPIPLHLRLPVGMTASGRFLIAILKPSGEKPPYATVVAGPFP